MAALSSRFFLAFGAYGAEQKRVLLDEQNLQLVDALPSFRATLRAKGHDGSFFRDNFVLGYMSGSQIAGKMYKNGCSQKFGAFTSEYHVWLHVTSVNHLERSAHEKKVSFNGGPASLLTSFFGPTPTGPAVSTALLADTAILAVALPRAATAAVPPVATEAVPPVAMKLLGGPEEFSCLGYRPPEFSRFAAEWPWLLELEGMYSTTKNGGAVHSNKCEPVTSSTYGICEKCSALKYHLGLQKVVAKAANSAAAAVSHENDAYVSLATTGIRRDNQRGEKNATWPCVEACVATAEHRRERPHQRAQHDWAPLYSRR